MIKKSLLIAIEGNRSQLTCQTKMTKTVTTCVGYEWASFCGKHFPVGFRFDWLPLEWWKRSPGGSVQSPKTQRSRLVWQAWQAGGAGEERPFVAFGWSPGWRASQRPILITELHFTRAAVYWAAGGPAIICNYAGDEPRRQRQRKEMTCRRCVPAVYASMRPASLGNNGMERKHRDGAWSFHLSQWNSIVYP